LHGDCGEGGVMKKLIFLFALFAISCNPFENISEVKKGEEALKNPRFKELPEEEMYAFLNEVYLKKWDSLHVALRIYAHPLNYMPEANKIFDEEYKLGSSQIKKQISPRVHLESLNPKPDTNYTWNREKLTSVKLIYDVEKYMDTARYKSITYISKLFFDKKENVIIIREHPDGPWCCECRGENICFSKTDSGWTRVSCPATILYR
jgi:hypothetical protein